MADLPKSSWKKSPMMQPNRASAGPSQHHKNHDSNLTSVGNSYIPSSWFFVWDDFWYIWLNICTCYCVTGWGRVHSGGYHRTRERIQRLCTETVWNHRYWTSQGMPIMCTFPTGRKFNRNLNFTFSLMAYSLNLKFHYLLDILKPYMSKFQISKFAIT